MSGLRGEQAGGQQPPGDPQGCARHIHREAHSFYDGILGENFSFDVLQAGHGSVHPQRRVPSPGGGGGLRAGEQGGVPQRDGAGPGHGGGRGQGGRPAALPRHQVRLHVRRGLHRAPRQPVHPHAAFGAGGPYILSNIYIFPYFIIYSRTALSWLPCSRLPTPPRPTSGAR